MAGKPRTKAGTLRAVSKARIPDLLALGYKPARIMEELNISSDTFYQACREIREELSTSKVASTKALKIVEVAERTLTMALADYDTMRRVSLNEKGEIDPVKYSSLFKQIRVIRETKDSLEKTYARFGLIPSEKHVVEQVGDIAPAVKIFAVDPSLYDEALNGRKE